MTACGFCGSEYEVMHHDHIVPKARGGGDDAQNCLLSCPGCNLEKSDRLPSEWKPNGLPPLVYELEAILTQKYSMKPRGSRGRKKATEPVVPQIHCYFCGETFECIRDCFMQISDQEVPPFKSKLVERTLFDGTTALYPALAYPGIGRQLTVSGRWNGWKQMIHWAHATCGPEHAHYWIPPDRMFEKSPPEWMQSFDHVPGWEWHLKTKGWFMPQIVDALEKTRAWAEAYYPAEAKKLRRGR